MNISGEITYKGLTAESIMDAATEHGLGVEARGTDAAVFWTGPTDEGYLSAALALHQVILREFPVPACGTVLVTGVEGNWALVAEGYELQVADALLVPDRATLETVEDTDQSRRREDDILRYLCQCAPVSRRVIAEKFPGGEMPDAAVEVSPGMWAHARRYATEDTSEFFHTADKVHEYLRDNSPVGDGALDDYISCNGRLVNLMYWPSDVKAALVADGRAVRSADGMYSATSSVGLDVVVTAEKLRDHLATCRIASVRTLMGLGLGHEKEALDYLEHCGVVAPVPGYPDLRGLVSGDGTPPRV